MGELLGGPDLCFQGVVTLPEGASYSTAGLAESELCGPNSVCLDLSGTSDPICVDACATSEGSFGTMHLDCRNQSTICQDVLGREDLGLCL